MQAGVVKDQLNAAVAASGLFFAPELSPSNWATIGGMIATDASGQGSVYKNTMHHQLPRLNMTTAIYLNGLDEHSGSTDRVLETENFNKDALRLFNKIYGKEFAGVKWFCGVPGKDVAVVFQSTPYQGSRQEYLHLSYSDLRVW